jgi:hypothetical protein
MSRKRKTHGAFLAAAAGGAIALLASASTGGAATVTYTGTFVPENNSGVSGTTTVVLDDVANALTVTVSAAGLEPGQVHPQHIHGFADDSQSVLPPSVLTPTIDVNGNGRLDDEEGEALIGPPIIPLKLTSEPVPGDESTTDFPTADDGTISYNRTFVLSQELLDLLEPIDNRVVEIHGLSVDGVYDPTLPVAGAPLALVDDGGGGGGGGGGNAIPVPAAVWPGIMMLTALGGGKLMKGRQRR